MRDLAQEQGGACDRGKASHLQRPGLLAEGREGPLCAAFRVPQDRHPLERRQDAVPGQASTAGTASSASDSSHESELEAQLVRRGRARRPLRQAISTSTSAATCCSALPGYPFDDSGRFMMPAASRRGSACLADERVLPRRGDASSRCGRPTSSIAWGPSSRSRAGRLPRARCREYQREEGMSAPSRTSRSCSKRRSPRSIPSPAT